MTAIIDPPTTAAAITDLLNTGVSTAFKAYTQRAQLARTDLYGMSMSGLGGCSRQAAYRLSRTAPSDIGDWPEARAANIGTMIHEGLLEFLADHLGGVEELTVDLELGGLAISGRTDMYSPALQLVGDLKTIGTYRFGSLTETVNRAHRMQIGGYAIAVLRAGFPVRWVAWIYLDRSSGDHHVIVEELTDDFIAEVTERCTDLALYGAEPDAAPRDERGPGLSVVCDGCPWLRECWGMDAEPGVIGAQRILAQNNAAVQSALKLFDEARAKAKEAEEDKEFAKAMFSGAEPGRYGPFELSWSKPGMVKDKEAALREVEAAGLPVQYKPGARRVIVKRARQDT